MKIGNREISSNFPPYIVAEISCNHVGRIDYAQKLIEEAKDAGADAVKLQCYQADTITFNSDKPDFIIKDGPWRGRKLYELYKKCETPRKWFPHLFNHAKKVGIDIFASVFSPEDVDFLEHLHCPAFKIASMEITDIPLIEYTAKTGKPLIISSGMAEWTEIRDATQSVGKARGTPEGYYIDDFIVLYCVSGYPTPIEEIDLKHLKFLAQYNDSGISDHTIGWEIPVAATTLGACIIEKHLMLDLPVQEYNPEDFDFSMRPGEFYAMCRRVRQVWQAMQLSKRKSEESSHQLRRSLYVVQDIKAGDSFTTENVRSIRPAYGMAPKHLPRVLNSLASRDIEAGTALKEDHFI